MAGIATMVGWIFSRLSTLPSDGVDGQVEYMDDQLYVRDSSSWKAVGGQYKYSTAVPMWCKTYAVNAVSGSDGTFTITLPTGYFTAVHNVQASCWRASATSGNPAYAVLISMSATTVVGQTLMPAGTLLVNAAPVTAVGSIPVQVLITGV